MNRFVAALTAIAMVSGCATYESARTFRNAGIVVGVAGLAATVAGAIAVSRSNEASCTDNCDGVANPGPLLLTLSGVGLMGYGIMFGIIGAVGMEKHSPETLRQEQALAEQQRVERERVAREEREAAERDRERDRAAREKAHKREQAFALLKTAVQAARADQCPAAIAMEQQIRDLDLDVHDAWYAHDPDIKRCLAPTAPSPATEP
ncbi:MAG TPA: hypothetical protein VIV40_25155 [Kofleriaceae bacterium]